jgi:hypothetical protein
MYGCFIGRIIFSVIGGKVRVMVMVMVRIIVDVFIIV